MLKTSVEVLSRETDSPLLSNEVILLVGHGSRDSEGANEFKAFVKQFQQAFSNSNRPVSSCFLELTEPPILEEIERWVQQCVTKITMVPFFLLGAGHVKNDVPSAINLARLRFPQIEFRYGTPIGTHPLVLELLAERLQQLEQAHPSQVPASETVVLLVERGSSDPDANSEVYKVARMLWEGRGYKSVEVAFSGITRPLVPEGIDRCVQLGAKRVLVLPYFLFTGVLVKRIAEQAAQKNEQYPEVEIVSGEHFGPDARLVEIARDQLQKIEQGTAVMSCDLCKYRVKFTGFEQDFEAPQMSDHSHGLRGEHSHGHDHHHHDHSHNHSHD